MKINSDTRFTRRWELYNEFLDDDNFESFDFFLTQRLMEAEGCANRYEAALDSILEFCEEDSQRGNEASALRILVSAKAKEARKEAE